MEKRELPSAALEVMLKEHALLRDEINERLKTAFTHFAYAGVIAAFALPAADKVSEWIPQWIPLLTALVGLVGLCWVAALNMRWVQHAGAYIHRIEYRIAEHFGEATIGWEHYAESVRASMWGLIPRSPILPESSSEMPAAARPPVRPASPRSIVGMIFKRRLTIVAGLIVALLVFITSCTTASFTQQPPQTQGNRKLVVFFDGTSNDETSDTNVKKLHSLVSLQNRPDISTIYIEGVGAQGKIVGMATAWGIGHRVRIGYSYLLREYRPGDSIYLFGFSRGAYSARILAAMLYYAGLPGVDPSADRDFAGDLYDEYKGKAIDRRARIEQIFASRKLPKPSPVRVKLLGLWDTVEAHGIPDYAESVDEVNYRYGDQLCNIDRALHAVSVDDNRARIFTPILLTRPHLLDDCRELATALASSEAKARHIDKTVEEVWFSGAHSDVGGGYRDSLLSGVSLNWMMRQIRASNVDILPLGAIVREDAFGKSHDPESGIWGLIYRAKTRNLPQYARSGTTLYNDRKLKVHRSLILRLSNCDAAACKPQTHEYQWLVKEWGQDCFKDTMGKIEFIGSTNDTCFLGPPEQ